MALDSHTFARHSPLPDVRFTSTRWSVIQRAGGRDRALAHVALGELCQRYWPPCFAFIRRMGYSAHDAEDFTQAFFAKLLEKDSLIVADREKGKFRTFLLTVLKRFLANETERKQAKKRGGGQTIVSIDQSAAETRLDLPAARRMEPDVFFERQWALTILEKVIDRLKQEYAVSGRARLFEALKDCLARDPSAQPYADIAAQLRLTEPAVKMAVSRMRGRYREILRSEIADTVENPDDVDDEIRHLFAIFGS